jgi:hypothetical protein
MGSYIKASMERSYAESFLAELERNDNQYFLFIGKGTTWANESSPPAYTDSVASEYQIMNDIIGYKKLSPENVLFALPRYEWISGTVYDQYSDTTELFSENDPQIFYVVTDENKIYKCLSNNSGGTSTVKPSLVVTTPFTLSDGYTWQYLATVRESDLPYELTDYVPVDFAVTSTDTETQTQWNAQVDAVNASITRMTTVNAAGASAGVYPNTVDRSTSSPITAWVLNVASITPSTTIPTRKTIKVTESNSYALLSSLSSITDCVGYVMRVNNSTINPKEVNNYGVIVSASITSSPQEVTFVVEDDALPFTLTPSVNSSQFCSVQILPYVKIVGDGSGAYAFPVMNSNKTVSRMDVVSGGRNYSKVSARIVSPKTAVTVHPTITPVLSPKGGHGSNILKELNVKDVLIITKIDEYDAQVIRGGGNYRQFGIIKNPVLNDGSGRIAGKENFNYRDMTLISTDGIYDSGDFDLGVSNIVIGTETYASAKPLEVKTTTSSSVVLKTLNTSGKFITRQDRINDYDLTVGAVQSPFIVGETVRQTVPAGTLVGTSNYGFDLNVEGTVVNYSSGSPVVSVRLVSGGGFVDGLIMEGTRSGVTASVTAVHPRYGESVWITQTGVNSASFRTRGGNQKLYRVVDVGGAYFDLDQTPSYRGLHVLNVNSSISGVCGGTDTTSAPILPSSFSNGEFVQQGISGSIGNYASGTVFDWEYINPSYGRLYLTDVLGAFKSVATDGLTGTQIKEYIVSSVEAPQIDRTSGEVLYISNVRPIARTIGQEEEFRLRLGF